MSAGIDRSQLERLSRLAMVDIENEESMAAELQSILEFLSKIREVQVHATQKLEPSPPSEDGPGLCDEESAAAIRENFPNSSGNHIRIPSNR